MFKNKFLNTHVSSCKIIRNKINSGGENTKQLLLLYKEMSSIGIELGLEPISDMVQMEFLNTLSTLIDNPDEEVRMVVAELLFDINPKDALLFADKLLNDDNVWNRLKLIELLNDVNEPEALELIKKLTEDSEDMVKERAESLYEEKQTRI